LSVSSFESCRCLCAALFRAPLQQLTIEAKKYNSKVEVFNLLGQQVLSINLRQIQQIKQVHLVKVFMLYSHY
jgi:hypothetical protein